MPRSFDPKDLPPGLLEDYLRSARAQLAGLSELADRLIASGNDAEAMDLMRREVHKLHGTAGSYGFHEASRLAAGMDATLKDWIAHPDAKDVARGSMARWFVVRLAKILKLEVPPAGVRRPARPAETAFEVPPLPGPSRPAPSPPIPASPRSPPPPPPPPPTLRRPSLRRPTPGPPPAPPPPPPPPPAATELPWILPPDAASEEPPTAPAVEPTPEAAAPAVELPVASTPPAAEPPPTDAASTAPPTAPTAEPGPEAAAPAGESPPAPTPPAEEVTTEVPELIVVEDDAALAELVEYGLRARGYRFVCYRNGRDALRELLALDVAGKHPLVLMDVDLPGLDGYSVFAALERERPGTYRVVFTTVHGGEAEQLRGLEVGALDYLVKPISLRVALEKIRRWVGR